MKCVACHKELNKKDFLYTEDKEVVCVNPFTCQSPDHPNSVENIVKRGGAVKLFNEVELDENVFEKLNVSDEMKARIMKVATKPQSIRLTNLDIAHYIIALQEQRPELNSMSEAVRHCIQVAMQIEPLNGEPHNMANPSQAHVHVPSTTPQMDKLKRNDLTGIVVPDIPKSVNVDWSKVQPADVHPNVAVEDDEEDEF